MDFKHSNNVYTTNDFGELIRNSFPMLTISARGPKVINIAVEIGRKKKIGFAPEKESLGLNGRHDKRYFLGRLQRISPKPLGHMHI